MRGGAVEGVGSNEGRETMGSEEKLRDGKSG